MEIIGHQKTWQFLKKSAENQTLPHALLFSGEDSLGKKTLALEFVKFINCQKRKSGEEACQECFSCKSLQRKWHPDLILIDNKEGSLIQISQIREIQNFLNKTPFFSSFKSVIINHADKMTKDAGSCLLKTLEEPKGKTLFILITSFPNLIAKTIVSRCQKICFSSVPSQILADFLKDKKLSAEEKQKLVLISRGRPGKLIDFFSNPEKLERENQILNKILELSKKDLKSRFSYIKSLKKENIATEEIIKILMEYFRHSLLLQKKDSLNYSSSKLKEILEFLNKIYFLTSFTNTNKLLALELLMLKL